jgi:hypothetical protein
MVAVAIIAVTRRRLRWLALAHPVLTLLAIVATANHYFADAAVALVLVAVGGAAVLWGSSRLSRPAAAPALAPVGVEPVGARGNWTLPGLTTAGHEPVIDLRPERWTVDPTFGTAMAVGPPAVTSSPTAPPPSVGVWRVEMHRPSPSPDRRRDGQGDRRPDPRHRRPDGGGTGTDGAVAHDPAVEPVVPVEPVLDDGRDGELVGCSGC